MMNERQDEEQPQSHDSWRALYNGSKWSDFHATASDYPRRTRAAEEGSPVIPS